MNVLKHSQEMLVARLVDIIASVTFQHFEKYHSLHKIQSRTHTHSHSHAHLQRQREREGECVYVYETECVC